MCGVVCIESFGVNKCRKNFAIAAFLVEPNWEHFSVMTARADNGEYVSMLWDIYERTNKASLDFTASINQSTDRLAKGENVMPGGNYCMWVIYIWDSFVFL